MENKYECECGCECDDECEDECDDERDRECDEQCDDECDCKLYVDYGFVTKWSRGFPVSESWQATPLAQQQQ